MKNIACIFCAVYPGIELNRPRTIHSTYKKCIVRDCILAAKCSRKVLKFNRHNENHLFWFARLEHNFFFLESIRKTI